MRKKIADMTEAEINEAMRKQKIRKDSRALRKYAERLKKERKVYHQTFDAYAINQRRSREAALGACALKALDEVRGLNKVKKLIGELEFAINEQKVEDADGKKGYHYFVTYYVMSAEAAHTEEDIQKEIEQTFEKMMQETDELYPAEEKNDRTGNQ